MMLFQNNTVRYLIMIMICLGMAPLKADARVMLETEIVSGTITQVTDNAVELDGNGIYYYPAKKTMTMDLKAGNVVTIRYYVDHGDSDKPKYVEYAPGKNTLVKKTPPPVDKSPK